MILREENKELKDKLDSIYKNQIEAAKLQKESAEKHQAFLNSLEEKEQAKLERKEKRNDRKSQPLRAPINDAQFAYLLDSACVNLSRPDIQARSRVSFLLLRFFALEADQLRNIKLYDLREFLLRKKERRNKSVKTLRNKKGKTIDYRMFRLKN
jgi:hypothetical protein